ncbi:MAG TPA: class I SAM-dependent methyltransferase, partial [Ktedonobacteraceae bacterium]|nr:class I SAM-dependent methyltransferase [Ktedonobacteraceae bacterium]
MSSLSPNPQDRPTSYDHFLQAYEDGNPPWDTRITPPELVAQIEGPQTRPAGRALDLGCGTGTNSLYLAGHGWDVTGIDFISSAIEQAREKQRGIGTLAGNVHFLVGDVTRLNALKLDTGYTLLFDLGCLHSIEASARGR